MYFITEDELKSKYDIKLKTPHCVVNGSAATYRSLVNGLHLYKEEMGGPFANVMVINIRNNGNPDSDYVRERKRRKS